MSEEEYNTSEQERPPAGRRIALIVGTNGQTRPERDALKYASRSAKDVAEALREHCGFELLQPPLLDEQADTEKTRKALYSLVLDCRPDDFLLFYFCGHGAPLLIEAEQRDVYLVTHDFDPKYVEKIDKNAHISFRWLNEILYEKTDAGTVLIILDCCYAGNAGYQREEQPLEDLKKSIEHCFQKYFGETQNQKGLRITIGAAGYNGTTFEEDGYTVLAKHLLPALRGERTDPVNNLGQLTYDRLVSYLREAGMKISTSNGPIDDVIIIATFFNLTLQARHERQQAEQHRAEEQKLRALAHHEFSRSLLQNRLESFVGRAPELKELRHEIAKMLKTGGYL